jgi:hypothetical protein
MGREDRQAVLFGALLGAATGSLLALLYRRAARERQLQGARPLPPGKVVRLGMSLVPVFRQLLDLLS